MLTRLRVLLAQGATFREAAGRLGRPHVTLFDLAKRYQVPHRRAGLSPEKERKIQARLARDQSLQRIAREVGVSSRTVHLRKLRRLIKLSAGPLPCAEWRCPTCGARLLVSRCIADGTPKPARTVRTSKRPRS